MEGRRCDASEGRTEADGRSPRVRRAIVALLNELAPFNDYLGEKDVAARFRLLAKDLATRG
ncbi:MAG: hypothetical protein EBT79_12190 [Actinobacteria bacterium]|nr:hypothetical protein [Actinomycetota bacterium]NBR68005.1 hypothetical protein [Actinomycetota bacterium]